MTRTRLKKISVETHYPNGTPIPLVPIRLIDTHGSHNLLANYYLQMVVGGPNSVLSNALGQTCRGFERIVRDGIHLARRIERVSRNFPEVYAQELPSIWGETDQLMDLIKLYKIDLEPSYQNGNWIAGVHIENADGTISYVTEEAPYDHVVFLVILKAVFGEQVPAL